MWTSDIRTVDPKPTLTRRDLTVRALAAAAGFTAISASATSAKTTGNFNEARDRNLMNKLPPNASEEIDRVAVCDIVQRERMARDMHRWTEFAAAYNPDSQVDISWFKGSGADFVVASRKMAAAGVKSFHQMGATIANIRGNRGLADTSCAIHLMGTVEGIEVDVIGHTRLYARVERKTDRWLMSGFRVVYIQDTMMPLDPTRAPHLDAAVLATYRPSYRFVSFMLGQNGHTPRNDLPGVDRPETVDALLKGEEEWLNGHIQ